MIYYLTKKFSISESIINAQRNFKHIHNDGLKESIGNIWSIKKFLLLDYYMPVFIDIVSKNNFKKFYYADPFCGSGKFAGFKDSILKKKSFPGSALIGALHASSLGYTDCIFSDIKQIYVDSLNIRLKNSKTVLKGISYNAKTMDFESAVNKILSLKGYQVAILVLIDPAAYVPIKWDLMIRLAKKVGIDIIFNFYTHRIAHNVSATKKNNKLEKNLNEFFGNDSWKEIRDGPRTSSSLGEKLLKFYSDRLGMVTNKKVIPIGVYRKGSSKLYDLVIITRSEAGAKVIKDAKKVMEKATTEAITREFKTQISSQTRLFKK